MRYAKPVFVLIFLILTATALAIAQDQNKARRSESARDPQPEDAIPAVIAAFNSFPIVAISDVHGGKDVGDFILALVRHPEFPNTVNDIVIEWANSDLQNTLDRYVNGGDVPDADFQRLWQCCGTVPRYWGIGEFRPQLLQLIRRINQKLPPAKRLRVLSGEPAFDRQVAQPDQWRDIHTASVIENEVLAKNRKALMFYGGGHLLHGTNNFAVSRYEQKYPGSTLVIVPWIGRIQRDRCGLPVNLAAAQQSQLSAWPVPSLVPLAGTWLADVDPQASPDSKGGGTFDAYLYLGPPSLLLSQPDALQVRQQDTNLLRCEAGR